MFFSFISPKSASIKPILSLVFMSCFSAGALAQNNVVKAGNPEIKGTIMGTVVRVHDGDTITFKSDKGNQSNIRFLGIDTPETDYNGQSQGEYAQKAREFLLSKIPVGSLVKIVTDTEVKDKYGRLLGYVYANQVNINLQMIKEGYAVDYIIAPNINSYKEFSAACKLAQEQGLGIWNPKKPLAELPYNFRHRLAKTGNVRYVGSITQNFFVAPQEMEDILVWDRIFFNTAEDAVRFGFQNKQTGKKGKDLKNAPNSLMAADALLDYNSAEQ